MGINAQTSVPKFTAGDTLTAANTNLLANGIPVFAGTATRDAAFDGAGEKALAEGQYAYLEDTNATQFYDGAAWQPLGGGEAAISFTPTFTNYTRGNGTSVAYYMRVNKLVYVYVKETLGSTSSVTGGISLALPIAAVRAEAVQIGRSRIDDIGTNIYWGTTHAANTTSCSLFADLASGTYTSLAGITALVPMTWATTDAFTFSFVYEVA
jgi:hypothetical protein